MKLSTSLRKVLIFFVKQISSTTKASVSEIKNQIEFQKIIDEESFQVFQLQFIAQVDEVLILKMPVVQDEVIECEIGLKNLSL